MKATVRMLHFEELEGPARWINVPGLLIEGDDYIVGVFLDGGRIRAKKFPEGRILQFEHVLYHDKPYPLERYWDQVQSTAQTYPATKQAREWLIKVDPENGKKVRVELDPDKPGGRGATIAELCESLDINPKKARKYLRSKGLNAPYTDFDALWKLLKVSPKSLRLSRDHQEEQSA